jgi:hypothetical protein
MVAGLGGLNLVGADGGQVGEQAGENRVVVTHSHFLAAPAFARYHATVDSMPSPRAILAANLPPAKPKRPIAYVVSRPVWLDPNVFRRCSPPR